MGRELYRRAHLLTLRPPLWSGGHSYVPVGDRLHRCILCHSIVPGWALDEGFWMVFAGRWCRGLFAALPPAPLSAAHDPRALPPDAPGSTTETGV